SPHIRRGGLVSGVAKVQAERPVLLGPLIWHSGSSQPLSGEVRRLASFADRFDDRWREKRQRDQASDVAVVQTFPLRDLACIGGTVGGELGEPAPAANNRFEEQRV